MRPNCALLFTGTGNTNCSYSSFFTYSKDSIVPLLDTYPTQHLTNQFKRLLRENNVDLDTIPEFCKEIDIRVSELE